jgi:hypothetical protein
METNHNDQSGGRDKKGYITTANKGNKKLSLFDSLKMVERDFYIEEYGLDSLVDDPLTAVADNIAVASLNQSIYKKGFLEVGDQLLVKVFCDDELVVTIEKTDYSNDIWSVVGRINDTGFGYLNLAIASHLVLASINLSEINSFYLLRFNRSSGKHYLFKAFSDKLGRPACY